MTSNLILASKSLSRQTMLSNVGLAFEAEPADLDEDSILKDLLRQGVGPQKIAATLAQQKALKISQKYTDKIVIGSDQILVCDDKILQKAQHKDEALEKLKSLSGKTHYLIASVCITQNSKVLWDHTEEASLTMHALSDDDLVQYCSIAGEALMRSVGAYELEKHGSLLFEKVQGDFFTILGMPLLPLLSYLHRSGYIGFEMFTEAVA